MKLGFYCRCLFLLFFAEFSSAGNNLPYRINQIAQDQTAKAISHRSVPTGVSRNRTSNQSKDKTNGQVILLQTNLEPGIKSYNFFGREVSTEFVPCNDASVPEPATVILLMLGFGWILMSIKPHKHKT